jgi:hypothetical protein
MNLQSQKVVTTLSVSWVVLGGFEALIYLLGINQEFFFLRVSLYIYLYLALKMAVLYDLHFKNPGALHRAKARHESVSHWLVRSMRTWASAIHDRFHHLFHWKEFRHFQNYLLLPALIYWATVGLLYINFGKMPLQQTFALLSSAALIVCYWYLKEIFYRKQEKVDADIIRILTVIKLYAAFLLYAATIGLTRYFCLDPQYAVLGVLLLTFWLMYQAIFQYNFVTAASLYLALAVSVLLAGMSYFVYLYWGLNYFTAGVFLMAWYNFFWGIVHHFLHRDHFDGKVFLELLLMTLLISVMMLGVTNFRARLLNVC